ncbi:unnamed protein product [Polarella glacialis]|uniref:TLC domain-containing protein n=1 Tax=Polarella glacialis TaxID=89957 RepID=A0A813GNC5_POLGL|nr:unnamed protein product [Polarella glacialis]
MEAAAIFSSSTFRCTVAYYVAGHIVLLPLLRRSEGTERGRSERQSPSVRSLELVRQVLSIPALVLMACTGLQMWFTSVPGFNATTAEERLFGRGAAESPASEQLALFAFSYTVVDLVLLVAMACISAKPRELQTMLAHHVCMVALVYHSLRSSWVQYYGVFYVGVAEASSVPLAAMNLLRLANEGRSKPLLPRLGMLLQISFAALFLVIRGPCWLFVNYRFFSDAVPLLSAASESRHGVGVTAICMWLLANILLTVLQIHWARKIVRGASAA